MEQVFAQAIADEIPQAATGAVASDQGWGARPAEPQAPAADTAEWRRLRDELRSLAEREGWVMAEVSRRAGVAGSTFSSWYSGRYRGSFGETNAKLVRFLAAYAEQRQAGLALLREPDFLETPTAKKILDALLYAQILPGMVLVTTGPGMGKSSSVAHVRRTRPNTWHVVMSPATRKVPALLRSLALALGIPTCHPSQLELLIGEKLQRNGRQTLLMVDEAQNLDDDAVNQLRRFNDVNECGIALLGNEDVHKRWGAVTPKPGYGQLHSRFDDRVRVLKPTAADIDAYIAAWGIDDADVVKLLRVVGQAPGALRQIGKTIKVAGTLAGPQGRSINADDIRRAWARRSGEDLR